MRFDRSPICEGSDVTVFFASLSREMHAVTKKNVSALSTADGRIYYVNHETKNCSWIPPMDCWYSDQGLPYGWEVAVDKKGKPYYINHVNKTTTYENPRKDDDEPPPQPREVELCRHPELGFGFVAGSERPVIVRFVKEGGPSEQKLQSGDQILKINGEDVVNARREHVIELVKSCKHSVVLTVCQPHTNNTLRKSALLTASKKAKLKTNPSRVRFAEGVVINGSPLYCPSPFESCVPFIPNVLKVFLENGQTKTFKYDSSTIIQDVLNSLLEKLSIKCSEYFSLCVEHIKSMRRNKLILLDPKDTLQKIAARPGAHNLRCLFRVAFVPKDAFELFERDPISFEYLYVQCCNDVVQERFSPELKYEIALRLSALHLFQHAISNGMLSSNGKVNLKAIEKECGLEAFIPFSLLETMKRKELHKLLNHFLKQNQQLCPPGQKSLTALQAKMHYLKVISELPSYGAKMFPTNIRDSSIESALLVSPKYGISHVTSLRHSLPISLAKIEDVSSVMVTKDDELCYTVEIQLKGSNSPPLHFGLEDKDAEEFALVLQGYHRLLSNCDDSEYDPIPVLWDVGESWWTDSAPSYNGQHLVKVAPWSYLPSNVNGKLRKIDLGVAPPMYSSSGNSIGAVPPNNGVGEDVRNVDHNMNTTGSLLTRTEDIDLPSIVSMEILECQKNGDISNVKNEDVIKRVEEMNQIVATAEKYLAVEESSKSKSNNDDDDSISISDHPRLKAADSLLLLTQIGDSAAIQSDNNVAAAITDDLSPCDSDTDSFGTPNDSPLHRPDNSSTKALNKENSNHCSLTVQMPSVSAMKTARSGSSFGLHSPDIFPQRTLSDVENELIETLNKLQNNEELRFPFGDETLCIDPDIIDLTVIPPPTSPMLDVFNNVGDRNGVSQMSDPPTPYRENCNTLQNKNSERSVTEINTESDTCISRTIHDSSDAPDGVSSTIDDFIASVCVPPPPTSEKQSSSNHGENGNNEDYLSSLIIPPPPLTSPNFNHTQDEIIARFWKATDDIKKICGVQSSKTESSPYLIPREVHSSNSGDSGYESVITSTPLSSGRCIPLFVDVNASGNDASGDLGKDNECGEKATQTRKRLSESWSFDDLYCWNKADEQRSPPLIPASSSSLLRSRSWTGLQKLKVSSRPPPVPKPPVNFSSLSRCERKRISHSKSNGLRSSFTGRYMPKLQQLKNGIIVGESFANGYNSAVPAPCPTNSYFLTEQVKDDIFLEAQRDIDLLVANIDEVYVNRLSDPSLCNFKDNEKYGAMKESLITKSRQFVTASKLFVKCATEASPEVVSHLLDCTSLLATIYSIGEHLILSVDEEKQVIALMAGLKEVAVTFACTVDTVHKLSEFVNSTYDASRSPYMALLMNHATALATALSALMRTLRVIDN